MSIPFSVKNAITLFLNLVSAFQRSPGIFVKISKKALVSGGENIGLQHQDAPKAQGAYHYYPTKPHRSTREQIAQKAGNKLQDDYLNY